MIPFLLIGSSVAGILVMVVLVLVRQPVAEVATDMATDDNARAPAIPSAKEKSKQNLRERLIHAGLYKQNSPTSFYMTQIAFVAMPMVIGFFSYRLGLIGFNVAVLSGLGSGIAGVVAPGLWLDYCKSRRQTKIRRSIPDALDVITICVEAGLSLNASIVRVSKDLGETYPLLATELTIVHRHVQMGKTAGEALRSFAERFDLSELRSLSSVVTQSEKYGASIASALRVHGDTLRRKRMQKAKEKAAKAGVWILLPTVIFIFPALIVVILGPAAYDIYNLFQNLEK